MHKPTLPYEALLMINWAVDLPWENPRVRNAGTYQHGAEEQAAPLAIIRCLAHLCEMQHCTVAGAELSAETSSVNSIPGSSFRLLLNETHCSTHSGLIPELLLTLRPDPQAPAHTCLLETLRCRVNTLNIVLSAMLSTVLSTKQMLQLAAGCPGASGACARDNPASRGAPDCSHGTSI